MYKKRQEALERQEREGQDKRRDGEDRDASGSPHGEQTQATFLRKLEEMHQQKIQSYIGKFEQKHENRREKTGLYKNKHVVQAVQRTETFFIKDLKEKIHSRYQVLREDFASKYERQPGPNFSTLTDEALHQSFTQDLRRDAGAAQALDPVGALKAW